MCRFIQSLESRTLLSATLTREMVLADQMGVIADVAATRVNFKAVASGIAADTRTIAADLKSLATPASRTANAALLATLRADAHTGLATLRADNAHLLGVTSGVLHRSSAHALALLAHPTNTKLQALVAADMAALATVAAAPLAQLQADLQGFSLDADLTGIADANPTGTQLATDVAGAKTSQAAAIGTFGASAVKVQTDAGALATDLAAAPTGSYPDLVGTYTGSTKTTSGSHAGTVGTLVVTITGESATGALTGSVTVTNPGQPAENQSLSGTVGTGGSFSATVTGTAGEGATLAGKASATKIGGTFASLDGRDGGTFSVTR
jgi:hypothetical protein